MPKSGNYELNAIRKRKWVGCRRRRRVAQRMLDRRVAEQKLQNMAIREARKRERRLDRAVATIKRKRLASTATPSQGSTEKIRRTPE